MSTETTEYEPVKVHVANLGELTGQPAPAGKTIGCRAYTVVLTATNAVQTILDQNPARKYALVQAGGNDVVINNNNGEINNPANVVTGLPNPIGAILPAGNTVPTKIPGGQVWYAAAAAYPSQVTVICVEES